MYVRKEPDRSRSRPAHERALGSKASLEELRRRLTGASPEFLRGAVENPNLTPRELLLLLRNRQAPAELLRTIADHRNWTRNQEVRRALVLHPRSPLAVARRFVPHLFWKELAEVVRAPHVHPVARRQAEKRLIAQVEELAEGERVALSRIASRGIIGALIDGAGTRELRALLGNPRLIEADAVRIASRDSSTPEALALLSDHERWGRRRQVRLALIENPNTPVPSALRMLRGLSKLDLERLRLGETVPRVVQVAAERLLHPSGRDGDSPRSPRWQDV
jgi:hypothetical protein